MTIDELNFGIEKLTAVAELKKLMASYFNPLNWARLPSTSVDLPWGAYDGFKGFVKCYKYDHEQPMTDDGYPLSPEEMEEYLADQSLFSENGLMIDHTYSTPVIEIAEDGQSARGVWLSAGCENFGIGDQITNEKDVGFGGWAWSKYAFDFRKIDGKWVIWHYLLFGFFIINYETSWADTRPYDGLSLMETTEDRPPTHEPFDWGIDKVYPYNYPEPPKPYRTLMDIYPGYGYLDEEGNVIESQIFNTRSTYDRKNDAANQ